MPGVALIAQFDGDPDDLAPRIRDAAHRYASMSTPQPAAALVLRNKDGITIALAWPDGTSLQPFRTFLREALDPLGLSPPRVEHFRSDAVSWDAITRSP